jgi:hypothetical protein
MQDELALAVSRDAPAMVVQVHVMEAAEQDAAIDVGAATVCIRVDVMRLAVRGGTVAVGDPASAVTDRERDTLLSGVETSLAAEIEWIGVLVV